MSGADWVGEITMILKLCNEKSVYKVSDADIVKNIINKIFIEKVKIMHYLNKIALTLNEETDIKIKEAYKYIDTKMREALDCTENAIEKLADKIGDNKAALFGITHIDENNTFSIQDEVRFMLKVDYGLIKTIVELTDINLREYEKLLKTIEYADQIIELLKETE